MVSYKLPTIFPRNNDKNERLFQLLQKAYVETRHKEDYVIHTDDLLVLTERVKGLLAVLKRTLND
jgi:hypothetical protein